MVTAAKRIELKQAECGDVDAEILNVKTKLSGKLQNEQHGDRLGGKLRRLELARERLTAELAAAEAEGRECGARLDAAEQALRLAQATSRQQSREARLQALQDLFPQTLDKLLDLFHTRRELLVEADEESERHSLPRLGRHRLLTTPKVLRSQDCEELRQLTGENAMMAATRLP